MRDELQDIQEKYALEQDPAKKRVILEQMLDLIQTGWEELFLSLSKEENPNKVLRLLAELNRVSDERQGTTQKQK